MKKFTILILILTQMLFFSACKGKKYASDLYLEGAFNTINYVTLYTQDPVTDAKTLKAEINQILKDLDNTFDIQGRLPNSTLQLISKKAGIEPVVVSSEVIYVLNEALRICELSQVEVDGEIVTLFDPTISPVWKVWDFPKNQYDNFDNKLEAKDIVEIKENVSEIIDEGLVNYKNIIIDEENSTVYLAKAGMEIDLGSIVKGYAADKVKEYLLGKGYNSAIINIGGNVQTIGDFFGEPYRIAIRTPYINWTNFRYDEDGNKLNETFGVLRIIDTSVVTSGTYEKYIKDRDGNEYHHILNPLNGLPIDNGVISITVVCENSTIADGYSTTLFALGLERGMELVKDIEEIETIWVVRNGKTMEVYISSGLEDSFSFNENVIEDGFVFKGVYNENT
ncbi:MAG: FAD:protein FMN transferase [Bacilli bacterium]|nr:FAD:protein FMN transferase [Bacilli bacterium]